MHTSVLDLSMFAVEVDGDVGGVDDVFPAWTPILDRIGVVVHRPFEVVGASMMLSLGIANFFAKGGRDSAGNPRMYAEIYLFDVGGCHGDPGYLDFVPAEKEVVIPDGPVAEGVDDVLRPNSLANEVLMQVNAHGITRLLVPDGPPVPAEIGRFVRMSAECRLRSVYAYTRDGKSVADPDVTVRSLSPIPERNVDAVIDPSAAARRDPRFGDPGDIEFANWVSRVERRISDVPGPIRAEVRAERDAVVVDGTTTERYRRANLDFALSRLVPARAAASG